MSLECDHVWYRVPSSVHRIVSRECPKLSSVAYMRTVLWITGTVLEVRYVIYLILHANPSIIPLLILVVFNDDLNSSDYMASNDKTIAEDWEGSDRCVI